MLADLTENECSTVLYSWMEMAASIHYMIVQRGQIESRLDQPQARQFLLTMHLANHTVPKEACPAQARFCPG